MDFPMVLECHMCEKELILPLYRHYAGRMKTHGRADICRSCACKKGAVNRPQNTKEYWQNDEVKKKHAKAISESEKYQKGIADRDTSGDKNSMYGKVHSDETRKKMKKAHTGLIRPNAKKWQKDQINLTKSVKGYQHNILGWYKAVKQRDRFQCTKCNSKKHLDSHHIKPIFILVKELLQNCEYTDPKDQYLWLIQQPEINDTKLENGITLCRTCHKEIHQNWGSHSPIVK